MLCLLSRIVLGISGLGPIKAIASVAVIAEYFTIPASYVASELIFRLQGKEAIYYAELAEAAGATHLFNLIGKWITQASKQLIEKEKTVEEINSVDNKETENTISTS